LLFAAFLSTRAFYRGTFPYQELNMGPRKKPERPSNVPQDAAEALDVHPEAELIRGKQPLELAIGEVPLRFAS
jgi:hypothetical protein